MARQFLDYTPLKFPHPDEKPIRVRPVVRTAFSDMADRLAAAEARSAELAEELSKARRTIHRLKSGKRPPPPPALKAVAAPADL